MTLLAPVTMPVGLSPTRGTSYPPPFRIINLSVSGTIWTADNPGITAGQGTPIYPGTSLLWVRPGDLWMVADTADVTCVISKDVEDWQPNPIAIATAILNSGVLIIDNPVTLIQETNTANQTYGPFDVSRYSSITFSVAFNSGATADRNFRLSFRTDDVGFTDSPTDFKVISTRCWRFGQSMSPEIYMATVPVRAKYAYLIVSDGTTAQYDISLIASYRPVDKLEQSFRATYGSVSGRQVMLRASFVVATGAQGSFGTTAPWFGPVAVYMTLAGASAAATTCLLVGKDDAGADVTLDQMVTTPQQNSYGTAGFLGAAAHGRGIFYLTGEAAAVRLFNGSGGDLTVTGFVVPIYDYN